jgi:acetyl/propionyl-CoA carboxylase alpha subunit
MLKLKRVFIANRGEIAGRIATTAHRMGIETAALCDKKSPPIFLAATITRFIEVHEENLALYLDGPRLIDLAVKAGCDCIHPGFGFLSENAQFAAMVADAGLKWIGPKANAIEKMASKATARTLAISADVPCVPGFQDFTVPDSETGDFSELENFARKAGFPLIIKAALGGGGKGMRLVRTMDELRPSTLRAHSEAKNSFGSGSLIIEKYIESPRHIEVQILADELGTVCAIGDRDCSVQRRHQKVLEEAPAPGINAKLRQELHECAAALAKAVDYCSAGTVEFLLDESLGSEHQRFYFLEMNTRLQVEHPVTEEVYGLDLVEWQFRIAMGERLPAEFSHLEPRGHSVEARLYAEDVNNDFFPAPGPVFGFLPATGPGIRWEIGIDTVDIVSTKFDPMVAKVIATGSDRQTAIARLALALKQTFFAASASNREFLIDICTSTEFMQKCVGTHFIAEQSAEIFAASERERARVEAVAKELLSLLELSGGNLTHTGPAGTHVPQPSDITSFSFSSTGKLAQKREEPGTLTMTAQSLWAVPGTPEMLCLVGHGSYLAAAGTTQFICSTGHYDGQTCYTVSIDGRQFSSTAKKKTEWSGRGVHTEGSHDIVAPVPGKVIKIGVKSGALVAAGVSAFVLESMKMEFEVKTQKAGQIGEIKVNEGDQVTTGDLLAIWADQKS